MSAQGRLQLTTRQGLQQGLSPLQMRYARMLEMTPPEIEEAVQAQLDENPALEEVTHPTHTDDTSLPHHSSRPRSRDLSEAYYDAMVSQAAEESLSDSLARQLGELHVSPRQKLVAEYVVGSLAPSGYLTRRPDAIALDISMSAGFDVETREVEEALARVQQLDPAGVGARDLRECLLLQLHRLEPSDTRDTAITILTRYYDAFSRLNRARLEHAPDIAPELITPAFELIKSLNPKPGGAVGGDAGQPVIPEFAVEADPDTGEVSLTVLNSIPELQISALFAEDADGENTTDHHKIAEARDFIRARRSEAETFMRLLRMRQETLMHVMGAIVKLQHRFFITEDPADIRPMVLRDVAEIVGCDLSTVSRATASKYVATPTAIYPLKFFFSERPVPERSDLSRGQLQKALRALIEGENPDAPLSDDALAEQLSAAGFDIARRTVAKYRGQLGFPSARLRRKL